MQAGDAAAQAEFRQAIRIKPRYAEAHYNLALELHRVGKEDEARSELNKAYELAPGLRNQTLRR